MANIRAHRGAQGRAMCEFMVEKKPSEIGVLNGY
jgi:hypothetical protein